MRQGGSPGQRDAQDNGNSVQPHTILQDAVSIDGAEGGVT
jgi:hypothetical protein